MNKMMEVLPRKWRNLDGRAPMRGRGSKDTNFGTNKKRGTYPYGNIIIQGGFPKPAKLPRDNNGNVEIRPMTIEIRRDLQRFTFNKVNSPIMLMVTRNHILTTN